MLFSDITVYAFTNARLRAMLSRLIQPQQFSQLCQVKNKRELAEALKGTAYAPALAGVSGPDFDPDVLAAALRGQAIKDSLAAVNVFGEGPSRRFACVYFQQYELESVKTALRLWHAKGFVKAAFYLDDKTAFCSPLDLNKLLAAGTIEEIIVLLNHTPYRGPLERARDKFKATGSSFYLEAALDKDYYQRLQLSAQALSSGDQAAVKQLLGVQIDMENIGSLIRFRKYYDLEMSAMMELLIPGGNQIKKDTVRDFYATDGLAKIVDMVAKARYQHIRELVTGRPELVEDFLYQVLMAQVKRILAGFPFTIGLAAAYLALKYRELRDLTAILYAKQYGWDADKTRPMLMGL